MTLQPKQKVFWEIIPSSGPCTDAKVSLQFGRNGIEVLIETVGEDGSKSWVVISRRWERYVTEISANCKQYMLTETATRTQVLASRDL